MKKKNRNLYLVETRGCGDFYIVSSDWNKAQEAVESELDKADYGFSVDRKVKSVKLIREEYIEDNGKRYFSGKDGINNFIICEEEK